MSTIFAVFDDPIAARRAVETLRNGPLNLDDVSIVTRSTESGKPLSNTDDVSAGEGAAVGAVWGGLVGLAALLIPGIGPFLAFGALGAALTGVVTGAIVGGITAALVDFSGIPEEEARGYEDMVREGKTLVAVKGRAEDMSEARNILHSAGADSIRGEQAPITGATGSITGTSSPVHVAMYDENGRRVDQELEYGATPTTAASTGYVSPTTRGIYDIPTTGATTTTGTSPVDSRTGQAQSWTSGEVVGEGQGTGPRKDTGAYDADQWVGEGQDDPSARPIRRDPNASELDDTTRR
jgi:uncharacterized membrane protein